MSARMVMLATLIAREYHVNVYVDCIYVVSIYEV